MTGPGGTASPVRLVGGRYELGDPIGTGGMAQVHRAVDVRLGRDVAVKVLRADLSRDSSFQARFRREAQAAASLSAPSIVSVYDTGTDADGTPYIVMELVDGRTLRDVLQAEGRLLPQRALEVVAEVCVALDAAHAAGIVHRDIKPANVMLDSAGAVKVMDFGIARAASDASSAMTQTAAVIGTAAYLSPEQARGETVDARSDLYSTGCLLYELVTGAPPFTGDNPVAVAYQHVREDPRPPSAYDDSLSPAVDAVVLKAMAKNPANRYQSAAEMRDDLLRAAAGEPVEATPVLVEAPVLAPAAILAPPPPPPDRTRLRAVAYGLFGLVLAGLVVCIALLVRGLLGTDSGLVPAPSLVGLTQRQAVAELSSAGLTVGEVQTRFAAEPFGTVLEQSPAAAILLRSGGSVELVLSKGVEMTLVPVEVVGQDRDAAAALLAERKLTIEEEVGQDGDFAAGTVLSISPQPGTQLAAGSPVRLVVATGRVQVPDVRGLTVQEAAGRLQQAGFSVGVQYRPDPGPPDVVLEQDPAGGTAARGSDVVVAVSQQPPPPSPSPSPQPSAASPRPSPSPSP